MKAPWSFFICHDESTWEDNDNHRISLLWSSGLLGGRQQLYLVGHLMHAY